ncbi:MAG: TraR/DksA family transcriptional regulator [Opitutales bacterium]|nr:TraR/DksA family transcriptional regulator [Opitutales bacterium]
MVGETGHISSKGPKPSLDKNRSSFPTGKKVDNSFQKKGKKQEKLSSSPLVTQAVSVSSKQVRAASIADILGRTPSSATKQAVKLPEKWKESYRKLLRLRTLLMDPTVSREKGDEELLEFVSDREKVLADIEAAIDRIVEGTYGVCEITHKPIEPNRLRLMPYVRYSLEGQQQVEAQEAYQQNAYDSEPFSEDKEEGLYSADGLTDLDE